MKKIILFAAEGFEEIEALTLVDVLRRGGVQCDICSINDYAVTGAHGIVIKADVIIDEVDFRSCDGIVLPGGMPGSENLKNNIRVLELIKDFYMSGKLIGAICAAPIALAEAGVLQGRKITSYPGVKDRLGNCIYTENPVEVDGNIITSRGPATSITFAFKILEYLGQTHEAEMLREGMMVNFMDEHIRG
jgi:4-methyl-5(b-hydroxyethyl)-thiazole monophosphate biosynthesis